ncbi:MAG: NTP transferase domain-containing protein, partial [Jatrophihabitans sp.]
KGELRLDGVRLIDRAVLACREAGCYPVHAVVRPGVDVPGARVVVNPEPERGMRSSLEIGVAAAGDAAAVAVLLVDAPGIGAQAVADTMHAWTPGRIAVATYAGRRGHPIVMAPSQWRAALELAGPDEGARRYLQTHPDLVDEVDVDGDPSDLDTPDDLARWQQTR